MFPSSTRSLFQKTQTGKRIRVRVNKLRLGRKAWSAPSGPCWAQSDTTALLFNLSGALFFKARLTPCSLRMVLGWREKLPCWVGEMRAWREVGGRGGVKEIRAVTDPWHCRHPHLKMNVQRAVQVFKMFFYFITLFCKGAPEGEKWYLAQICRFWTISKPHGLSSAQSTTSLWSKHLVPDHNPSLSFLCPFPAPCLGAPTMPPTLLALSRTLLGCHAAILLRWIMICVFGVIQGRSAWALVFLVGQKGTSVMLLKTLHTLMHVSLDIVILYPRVEVQKKRIKIH